MGILDFGFWDFGFWILGILGILAFGILGVLDFGDFGDFGFWDFGDPGSRDPGDPGSWILGILGGPGMYHQAIWSRCLEVRGSNPPWSAFGGHFKTNCI